MNNDRPNYRVAVYVHTHTHTHICVCCCCCSSGETSRGWEEAGDTYTHACLHASIVRASTRRGQERKVEREERNSKSIYISPGEKKLNTRRPSPGWNVPRHVAEQNEPFSTELYPISDFLSLFFPLFFQPPTPSSLARSHPPSPARASFPVQLCANPSLHTVLSTVSPAVRPRKRYFPAVSFVIRVKNLHRSRGKKRLGGRGGREGRGGVGWTLTREGKIRRKKDGITSGGVAYLISRSFAFEWTGSDIQAWEMRRMESCANACCEDPSERRGRLAGPRSEWNGTKTGAHEGETRKQEQDEWGRKEGRKKGRKEGGKSTASA